MLRRFADQDRSTCDVFLTDGIDSAQHGLYEKLLTD